MEERGCLRLLTCEVLFPQSEGSFVEYFTEEQIRRLESRLCEQVQRVLTDCNNVFLYGLYYAFRGSFMCVVYEEGIPPVMVDEVSIVIDNGQITKKIKLRDTEIQIRGTIYLHEKRNFLFRVSLHLRKGWKKKVLRRCPLCIDPDQRISFKDAQ